MLPIWPCKISQAGWLLTLLSFIRSCMIGTTNPSGLNVRQLAGSVVRYFVLSTHSGLNMSNILFPSYSAIVLVLLCGFIVRLYVKWLRSVEPWDGHVYRLFHRFPLWIVISLTETCFRSLPCFGCSGYFLCVPGFSHDGLVGQMT